MLAQEQRLLASWEINPAFDVAANLGHTQYQLGKYREAAEHLAFALRNWPGLANPKARALAEDRMKELRTKVGALKIQVSVPNAEVFVDGKRVGAAPLEAEVFVEPGERTVEAKLAVYEDARQVVQAAQGGEQTVSLTLAPRAQEGSGTAPPNNGGALAPPPPPVETGAPKLRKEVLIAGGAAAGTALILGVAFTVLANQRTNDAAAKNGELVKAMGPGICAQPSDACREIGGLIHDRVVFTNIAGVSFIGAGALVAATGVYVFVVQRAPKATLHAMPVVTRQGAAVMVGGVW